MNKTLAPGQRTGCVKVPASKSQAHRLLICAALGTEDSLIHCDGISKDITATIACLNALGADIQELPDGQIKVEPIKAVPAHEAELHCGESGSTLRFLLPVVGALGANAVFHMEGRLPQRPLAPLDEQLRAHGMHIRRMDELLCCSGQLQPGAYFLPGDVSSQYISGLLMALPHLSGDSSLSVSGPVESAGYITMTENALALSGVQIRKTGWQYHIPGNQRASLPRQLQVEADYSNAAFFLCIGALSADGICVKGLSPDSSQGDKAVLEILRRFGAELWILEDEVLIRKGKLRGCEIDAAPVPDLIPTLCVVAAMSEGETRIINAARLRLKESDRLLSTTRMLRALGADITELDDGLVIHGVEALTGGTVDTCGDHRIAMAAAVAACAAAGPVTVTGAECVQKSYPRFWEDYEQLTGGKV